MSNARTHRPAAAQLEAAAEPSSSAGARGGMSDWPSPGAPGVQFQRDLALASPRAVQLDECEDLHEQKQEYDTRIGQIWNDHEAVIIEYEELNDLVDGLDDRSVQHGDRIRSLRDQLKSKEGALECSTEDLPGRLAAILAEVEVLWADYMKADDRYGVLGNRCSDLWTRL